MGCPDLDHPRGRRKEEENRILKKKSHVMNQILKLTRDHRPFEVTRAWESVIAFGSFRATPQKKGGKCQTIWMAQLRTEKGTNGERFEENRKTKKPRRGGKFKTNEALGFLGENRPRMSPLAMRQGEASRRTTRPNQR